MSDQHAIIAAPLIAIFAAVALGVIMRATRVFKGDETGLITRIVMAVLLPIFVFTAIKGFGRPVLTVEVLKIPLVAWLVTGLTGGLAYLIGRFLLRLAGPGWVNEV